MMEGGGDKRENIAKITQIATIFSLKTICNQNQILVQYNREEGGENEKASKDKSNKIETTFLFFKKKLRANILKTC